MLREHVGARPGIVAMHDIFFDEPPYYLVMDYVDGPTLTGWAEAHAPLDSVPLAVRLELVPSSARHQLRGDILQSLRRFAESAAAYGNAVHLDAANGAAVAAGHVSRELAVGVPPGGELTTTQERQLFDLMQSQKRDAESSLFTAAVNASLKEHRPVWQEQIDRALGEQSQKLSVWNGRVSLRVTGAGLTAISFLRGIRLNSLNLTNNAIADLSPLEGMPLKNLQLSSNQIRDLAPLAGMPLVQLTLTGNVEIDDLHPIRGRPLEWLAIGQTRVRDLTPLMGMPLSHLSMGGRNSRERSPISDLSPLQNSPLEFLSMRFTEVTDLGPLAGLPLRVLDLGGSKPIRDLAPLLDCPQLTAVNLPPGRVDISVLRQHPNLERIGRSRSYVGDITTLPDKLQPVAEFWKDYDAQPAKK